MKRLLLFFAMLISLTLPFERLGGSFLRAQGNDPVLAGMILAYTNKAEKELKQQEQMMLLESTGHLWIKEEVQGVTDLQKEFNYYLDNFHSIISYAAQIYGFYHEIDRLVKHLGTFNDQLQHQTGNTLAVALSSNRNKIYRELIMNSVDIVNDIRQLCLSDTKMTEKERLEVLFSIRPKLKLMNQKLKRLTRAVKYTSLSDIWAETTMAEVRLTSPILYRNARKDGRET